MAIPLFTSVLWFPAGLLAFASGLLIRQAEQTWRPRRLLLAINFGTVALIGVVFVVATVFG